MTTEIEPLVEFINSGLVTVGAGSILRISRGGISNGGFQIAVAAEVNFDGSPYSLGGGTAITRPGFARVLSDVSILAEKTVPAENFEVAAGVFSGSDGTGTVEVSETLRLSGGLLQLGVAVGQPSAHLQLIGSTSKTLGAYTIENHGAATWTGTGNISAANAAEFQNMPAGSFDILNAASFAGDGAINNAGSFRKFAGDGISTIGLPFQNSGTVEVNSGTLQFIGGSIDGKGTVDGVLNLLAAAIKPGLSPGKITVDGNYA